MTVIDVGLTAVALKTIRTLTPRVTNSRILKLKIETQLTKVKVNQKVYSFYQIIYISSTIYLFILFMQSFIYVSRMNLSQLTRSARSCQRRCRNLRSHMGCQSRHQSGTGTCHHGNRVYTGIGTSGSVSGGKWHRQHMVAGGKYHTWPVWSGLSFLV